MTPVKAVLSLVSLAVYGLFFVFLAQLYVSSSSDAIQTAVPPADLVVGDLEKGKLLYGTCVACHGKSGEGGRMFNSPRLANQAPWYTKRQLIKFKEGVRGAHPQDIFGMQMAPMAKLLPDEAAINNVVAYIASLKPEKPADSGQGDPTKGQAIFAVCSTCHGRQAEGNPAQKAPKLTGQHAWYLSKQIKNFKGGLRGAHAADTEGKLMAPIAQTLTDDNAIADVIAYIQSLGAE